MIVVGDEAFGSEPRAGRAGGSFSRQDEVRKYQMPALDLPLLHRIIRHATHVTDLFFVEPYHRLLHDVFGPL